ncbi:MAG: hypothetical protein AB1505_21990, partial [Candidatus Latescibacterota bacterium]
MVNPRWFGQSKMRKLRQMRKHLGFIWRIARDPELLRAAPGGAAAVSQAAAGEPEAALPASAAPAALPAAAR